MKFRNIFKRPATAKSDSNDKKRPGSNDDESFKIRHVFSAFIGLPRVLHLVWTTQPFFTLILGLLNLLRGFTPALTVVITKYLIDSVVAAIHTHITTPVLIFVILQLAVTLLDRLLNTLSNIVQQLLQERVSNRVQLLILEKANTLDLAFFENSEFYDKLRRAAEEAGLTDLLPLLEGPTAIAFVSGDAVVAVIMRGTQNAPGRPPATVPLPLRVSLVKQDGRWLVDDLTPINSR